MAQHDFAPAWLNFPTPPSSKPSLNCEKLPEASVRLDNRSDVNRRRHNSSDGFESTNGCPGGGGFGRKEKNGWRGRSGAESGGTRGGVRVGGHSRSRPGACHGAKTKLLNENGSGENGHGKRDEGDTRKQFGAEDFPSLNPESERELNQNKAVAGGVWEHPPNPKSRTSKMMVIKRIPKEDQSSAYPATCPAQHLSSKNGTGLTVYKGLVPKPSALPVKGSRSSSSSPVDKMSQPRLMKLTRVRTDKKSEFLKALKQDRGDVEDLDERSQCKGNEILHMQNGNNSLRQRDENLNSYDPAARRENGNGNGTAPGMTQQVICSPAFPQADVLSSSLEAEHRLLKEMGWQEENENDETCAPLTEDEMREFQAISEQLQKNGLRKNGFLKNGLPHDFLGTWRNHAFQPTAENDDTETSSSDTSDDEV
nr:PREDICTED: vasculin [Lepisosteus oculatus]XP_015222845.1 PREDICTED: vasculin [Lepisosteus oculatus]XP_015222849.1 PREDICTED: vasculin [Lepisosteus oculatus]